MQSSVIRDSRYAKSVHETMTLDFKKWADIMFSNIRAYYEYLNSQFEQVVKLRCLCMAVNNKCNEQSKERINETNNQQSSKKYIKCPECGEAILLVPTLGQMIASIENHIVSHRKHPHDDLTLAHLKKPDIQLDLAQQVLLQASDMTTPSQKPFISL